MARYETQVGAGTPEDGRKEIPFEVALNLQMKLLERMIPDDIRPYLTDREDDPVRSALWERWMGKYIIGFNGFTEYCNEHRKDRAFIECAKQGNLDDADYRDMILSFETSEHGEPFFKDQEEINEFLDSLKLQLH
jgi:hypothetical protein